MIINCIAVDDEPLALDVIEHHASKVPYVNLKARLNSALEALDFLHKENVDLLFLDIQMPDLTGFELLKTLRHTPMIVFTTAYPNYAVESYDLNALDYLLKPISFDKFLRSVNKAKYRLDSSLEHPMTTPFMSTDFIFVKTEYKTVKISLDEILFIESLKDYVVFHLKTEKIQSLLSIKAVEAFLSKDLFVRVHRSFIISLDKIDEIERTTIIIGKNIIPIGDNYKEFFRTLIESRRL
ncbi:MAG TPA: LytTR family DNA-binding domain-containing protein [Cytophagales bacterium]|nr:LytTR family DNA-binding domain-containing protein [Cytophagales bacterium]